MRERELRERERKIQMMAFDKIRKLKYNKPLHPGVGIGRNSSA